MKPRLTPHFFGAILVFLAALTTAGLADSTWDGGGTDSNFSTAENWVDDQVPSESSPFSVLTFSGNTRLDPTLDSTTGSGFNVHSIIFDNTAGAFVLSEAGNRGFDILGSGNGTWGFITNNSTSTQTITAKIINRSFQGNLGTRFDTAAGNIIVSGTIAEFQDTDSGSPIVPELSKVGMGTLILSGTNTYTGDTTIEGGTLRVLGGAAIGDASAVIVTTGTFDVGAAETIGALNTTVTTGLVNLDDILTVTGGGAVAGAVSGSGGLTVNGGTLTLSGTNNYTGNTTVSAGTLDVTGTLTSALTIADGATLSGEGSTTGLLTLGDGSGATGAILTVDASTEPGAFKSVGLASNITGGTHTVNFSASPTGTGDITILNYGTGSFAGNLTDFTVGSGLAVSGRGSMFNNDTSDSSNKKITLTTGFGTRTWAAANTTANWSNGNTTDNNWVEGDNDFFDGDFVIFTDSNVDASAPTSAQTIILTGNVAPTTVTFSNNDFAYTIDDTTDNTETLTASGGLNVSGNNDVTLNVKISDATDITHSGTGNLTLGGGNVTNDFVGSIVVNGGGTLKDGSAAGISSFLGNAANTLTISNGSTFDINGNHDYEDRAAGSIIVSGVGNGTGANAGAIINTGAAATEAFSNQIDLAGDTTIGGTGRIEIDGALSTSGTDVTLTYVGTDELWLGGDNTSATELDTIVVNSFGGSRADGIVVNSNSALGNAVVNIEGGQLRSRGNKTVSNTINLNTGAASIGLDNGNPATFTLSGIVNVNAAGADIRPSFSSRTVQFTGTLQGTGANLEIRNGNTRIASGANVTWGGRFDIGDSNNTTSVLELGNGQTISNDIRVIESGNNGTTKRLALQSGATAATFSGDIELLENTDGTFDVNAGSGGTLTLSGVISQDSDGPGLDKIGDGTVILSGTNTYTARTQVQVGTLQIGNGSTTGTLGNDSNVDVATAATLNFNRSDAYTYGGVISGNGAVNVTTGTVNLTGTSTHTGLLTVFANANVGGEGTTDGNITFSGNTHTITIDGSTSAAFGTDSGTGTLDVSALDEDGFTVNLTGGGSGVVNVLQYDNGTTGIFTGDINKFVKGTGFGTRANAGMFADDGDFITVDTGIGEITWAGTDGAKPTHWDIDTTPNWTGAGTTFFNGDKVIFADSPGGGGGSLNPTLQSNIEASTVTFTNDNDDYVVNAVGTNTLSAAGGGINTTGAANVTINAEITGATAVTHSGTGTLTLTNANTYTGITTVNGNGGILNISNGSALGTTAGGTVVTADARLQLQGGITVSGESLDLSSASTGSDFVSLENVGGNNTWTGNITTDTRNYLRISGTSGFLTISGDIVTTAGTGDNTRALVLQGSDGNISGEISGVISGDGTLIKSSFDSGTWILSGNNTYTGPTTISNGTVQLGNGGTTGSLSGTSGITVNNAGANKGYLTVNRSNAFTQAADLNGQVITGTGGFRQIGTGTTTLSLANDYKGTTTVSAGTLLINGDHSGATGVVNVTGGTLSGEGTIGSDVIIGNGATHAAGDTDAAGSVATQTITGDATYQSGATLSWELVSNATNNPGTNFDQFTVSGTADFTSTTLDITFGSGVDFDTTFWNDGAGTNEWQILVGTVTNFNEITPNYITGAAGNSQYFKSSAFELAQSSFAGGGNTGIWLRQIQPVPEPSTFALMGLGLAAFGWARRSRKRAAVDKG